MSRFIFRWQYYPPKLSGNANTQRILPHAFIYADRVRGFPYTASPWNHVFWQEISPEHNIHTITVHKLDIIQPKDMNNQAKMRSLKRGIKTCLKLDIRNIKAKRDSNFIITLIGNFLCFRLEIWESTQFDKGSYSR